MPRPYGLVGLVVSLAVILLLTVIYLVGGVGVAAALEAGLRGPAHVAAMFRAAVAALGSGDVAPGSLPIFAIALAMYAALFAAVVTLAYWRGGREWRSLVAWTPWSPRRAGKAYWGLVVGGVVYGVAASVALSLAYPEAKQWSQVPHGLLGASFSFVIIVLAGPITEEMAFRGWIFTSLRSRLSFWPANVTSAAAFALAHWEHTHLYAIAVFPLGLMLGLAREESGSTRASAAFHAIYNAIALGFALLGPS